MGMENGEEIGYSPQESQKSGWFNFPKREIVKKAVQKSFLRGWRGQIIMEASQEGCKAGKREGFSPQECQEKIAQWQCWLMTWYCRLMTWPRKLVIEQWDTRRVEVQGRADS